MTLSSRHRSGPARPRLLAAAGAAALWLLLGAAAGWGHDLGTVQVYGTFLKSGAFHIDVVVDEEHLRTAQEGGPPHSTRYGRIAGLGEPTSGLMGRFLSDLADASTLAFDGLEVSPELEIAPPEPDGPAQRPGRAVLRLSGETPGGAHTFTWKNSLPLGRYPVVLRNEGEEGSLWQWLEGGHASPPFALAASVVPPPSPPLAQVAARYLRRGFAGVLPRGAEAILFMLGLALLCMRVRPMLVEGAAFAAAYGIALAAEVGGGLAGSAGTGPFHPMLAGLAALTLVGVALANLATPRTTSPRRPAATIVAPPPAFAPASAPTPDPAPVLGSAPASVLGPAPASAQAPTSSSLPALALAREWRPPRSLRGAARLVLVVCCGLVQGLAGAGLALRPGLPRGRAAAAVASYGLGAAAALGCVLAAAFLLFGAAFRLQPWYRHRVVVPGSVLLAAIGLFWSLQSFL